MKIKSAVHLLLLCVAASAAGCGPLASTSTPQVLIVTSTPVPATPTPFVLVVTATPQPALPTPLATATEVPSPTQPPPTATSAPIVLVTPGVVEPTATNVPVVPTNPPPPPVQPTQAPVVQNPCSLSPGKAGLLVVNHFDGDMTFTVANHEYHVPGHGQQVVQVDAGTPFTFSVSIVGVGKLNGGPYTLNAGECVRYEPHT
jgi:hypothetical protein